MWLSRLLHWATPLCEFKCTAHEQKYRTHLAATVLPRPSTWKSQSWPSLTKNKLCSKKQRCNVTPLVTTITVIYQYPGGCPFGKRQMRRAKDCCVIYSDPLVSGIKCIRPCGRLVSGGQVTGVASCSCQMPPQLNPCHPWHSSNSKTKSKLTAEAEAALKCFTQAYLCPFDLDPFCWTVRIYCKSNVINYSLGLFQVDFRRQKFMNE